MFFSSYIRIKITGDNTTEFLNNCLKNGYELKNIRRKSDICFADVRSRHCKAVFEIARKNFVETKITGRFGLVMKLFIYRSRKAFFAMVAILTLYYGVNSFFISEIEINGNSSFTKSQITNVLKENDLYVGRLKFGINPEIFRNDVIKDFPSLSWLWLKIDGTKAIVDVREKVTKPEFFDYNYYCNVVASRDGVISKAVASAGKLTVSEGMFVKKGDILVNGVYDSTDFAPVRFVNAGGEIYARTTYSENDEFDCRFISYKPLSEEKTVYGIKFFDINLFDGAHNAQFCITQNKDEFKFKIFGKNYLPLAFTKTKYCEIIKEEYTLSQNEAKKLAREELCRRINIRAGEGAQLLDVRENFTDLGDGKFSLSVTCEYVEDIAEKLPIEIDNGY